MDPTPNSPDALSTLIALVPVLLGGVIAIVGAATGPFMTHRLQRESERRKRRIEMFEEMIGKLYDYELWVDDMKSNLAFGEKIALPASPLPRVRTIATLHFQEAEEALENLQSAELDYKLWMLNAQKKRLSGDVGNLTDGFEIAYRPFGGAFRKAEEALHQLARELGTQS